MAYISRTPLTQAFPRNIRPSSEGLVVVGAYCATGIPRSWSAWICSALRLGVGAVRDRFGALCFLFGF